MLRAHPLLASLLSVGLVLACGTKRLSSGKSMVPDESRSNPLVTGSEQSASGTHAEATTAEPGVLVVGRSVSGERGPRFGWPGTQVKARFFGSSLSVDLREEEADEGSQYEVILDGHRMERLVTVPGEQRYLIASGLSPRVHEVVLWRRNEYSFGPTEFLGFDDFGPGGQLLPPPTLSSRRIEIIGDSTSVGFGNEGGPGCKGTRDNQNNYYAYGSVAARLLGADVVTVAWSGVGVYRNFDEDGPSADTIGEIYDYAFFDPRLLWNASGYEPQVVVMGLGSNDYSTRGDPGPPFVEAYVDFVKHVREQYSGAEIVLLIQRDVIGPNVEEVVRVVRAEGDARVRSFDIRVDQGAAGCDGHPGVDRHARLGQKLAAELERLMGWNRIDPGP